jgi:hypothetical protein
MPWRRVLPEKLTVPQPASNSMYFMELEVLLPFTLVPVLSHIS